MPINEHIQAWRRMRGNSVTALAGKVGMPSTELEAIEAGELDPPASRLEALATALGIPPD
ncbi:helix-turn-helix domain-containing protein [Nitrospira sp. M1]